MILGDHRHAGGFDQFKEVQWRWRFYDFIEGDRRRAKSGRLLIEA
jgi:hypothetical protein